MVKPRLDEPLTATQLRVMLDYNPKTGIFIWNWRPGLHGSTNARYARKVAGRPDGVGYIRIDINSRHYLAHRLAWLYVHGRWPTGQIDHINMDKADNRIANLREVTHGQNNVRPKAMRNSRSGVVGVFLKNGHWVATISHEKQRTHLGPFDTIEEARDAREAEAKRLRGAFHRT